MLVDQLIGLGCGFRQKGICPGVGIGKDRLLVADDLLVLLDLIGDLRRSSTRSSSSSSLFTMILVVDSGWNLQLSIYSSISPINCSILLILLPYSFPLILF